MRYWILDDESLTLNSLQELEMMLEATNELTTDDAKQLSAPGNIFDAKGTDSMGAMSASEIARLDGL